MPSSTTMPFLDTEGGSTTTTEWTTQFSRKEQLTLAVR
jgi:hypothetical protein